MRTDAGFTYNDTMEELEDRKIEYLGQLRTHKGLHTLSEPYSVDRLSSLGVMQRP